MRAVIPHGYPPSSLLLIFFLNHTATTEIYTLSLHDALPIFNNNIDDDCQGFYNEQLVQLALVTIITNSVQAGATEINISADNSDGLVIHIEDNGHGFSEKILTGEKQTTKYDGSGLGLYFVRLIAEHHKQGDKQGHIKYGNRSKKNGAIVSIYLP